MNCFFGIVIFGLLATLLQISASTEKEVNKEIQVSLEGSFPDSSTRCGDVLRSSSGTISYKSFSPASLNERCIWTVRYPNATSYVIHVQNLGRSSSVIVSAISGNPISMETFIPTSSSSANINGSVLVITFYSTSTTETGFTLRYGVRYTDGNEGNSSREVMARADAGHIKHPLVGSKYLNNDLSVFLFAPTNGKAELWKKTEVIYIRDNLEGQSCFDLVRVFIFDVNQSGTNKWKSLGDVCGGVDSEVISSSDLIMLVFSSDGTGEYRGFHLYSYIRETQFVPF